MKDFLLSPLKISIFIYIIIIIAIIQFNPSIFYVNNNSTKKLKVFGTGSKNKTIFPLWFVMIVTAIIIYFLVCLVLGKIA